MAAASSKAAPTGRRAQKGQMVYGEFATDPCRSLFKRVQTLFSQMALNDALPDNANINVTKLGERFIAMTETPLPVQFDARTLKAADVRPYRTPGQLTTAHPHLDRASGSMLNYAANLGPRSSYRFFLVGPQRHRAARDRLAAREAPLLHALLRSHRALDRARRVPARRQPAGARAVRPALHRELPLEARAGHALHADRPRQRRGGRAASRPTPASPSTTSTPTTTMARSSSTCAPSRTQASSRISTSTACAPASRWRRPR